MDKDSSLFMWLDEAKESKIYVFYDFSLNFVGRGDVTYRHGKIVKFVMFQISLPFCCMFLSWHIHVRMWNCFHIGSMFVI
jgi:hypothetical protein